MLRARVLAALIGLLLVTVLSAFFVVSGAVLRPLILSLNAERAEIAAFIVDEAEEADEVEARLYRLARLMHVQVEVFDRLPGHRRRRHRRQRRTPRWMREMMTLRRGLRRIQLKSIWIPTRTTMSC